MLFSPPDVDTYKLWSAPRCLALLCVGILIFALSVGISLSLIHIRPSAEIDIAAYQETNTISLREADSLAAHDPESATSLRIMYEDGRIVEYDLDDQELKQKLHDDQEKRAAFLICQPRSVWAFLWQRLSYRMGFSQ